VVRAGVSVSGGALMVGKIAIDRFVGSLEGAIGNVDGAIGNA
jgi:hypothetical protein